MKDINNDILIDTNDYEEQKKLLSDEKKENQSIKKDIIKSFIFLLVIILIIITAYLTIYIYKIYGKKKLDFFKDDFDIKVNVVINKKGLVHDTLGGNYHEKE